MRRRVASLLQGMRNTFHTGQVAEEKLGIPATWSKNQDWYACLASWSLNDVLDLITVIYQALSREHQERHYADPRPDAWVQQINDILTEENVAYEVDQKGGVHYRVDAEFARGRAATVAALVGARYENARDNFERGMAALSQASPNGKDAIRGVFASAEGLFRLMLTKSPRLTASEADKLKPVVQKVHAGDAAALGASMKMLESFKQWTEAAHFYRHEPGTEEVAQPPLELAIHLVSTGAAHIRWLVGLDQAEQAGAAKAN